MSLAVGPRGPKYHRIADQLRQAIQDGQYGPGDRLPAETALTTQFGVSLPTVRQALAVLRSEGLVESLHGLGTFVKHERRLQRRSRRRYGRARSDEKLLTSHLRHEMVFAGRAPVPSHVAEFLGLEPGVEVVIRRRRLYDKESGQLEEIGASYLPVEVAGDTILEERDVVPKALFLCVEDLVGRRYTTARDQWVARPATGAEADEFAVPGATPVLHLVHVARDEHGGVLEVSESVWPADRVVVVDEYMVGQEPSLSDERSDV